MSDRSGSWSRRVREHARASGVELPEATLDELAVHLEDLESDARERGESPDAAQRTALRALKESTLKELAERAARDPRRSVARQSEATARAARSGSPLVAWSTSLRVAFRQLQQHPGFSFLTVLVLGLGVGAATTVFTVVDAVVLRPLPYEAPERLVTLWDTNLAEGHFHDPISPVNFSDQRELPVFEDAAAWWRPGINLVDPGIDPVRVNTIEVSGNLFEVLGVRPQVGAGFPQDGPLFVQNELIAVISDRLWSTRYGRDPTLVGRQIDLNDTLYTVVGIMPAGFHFPDDIDVWERLRWDMTEHDRQARFMEAVARLSSDTTIEQAQSAVDALWTRLETETAETANSTGAGWGSRLVPLLDEQLGYYRPALFVLLGAVGLLLVIGVLNVASLLLTRAISREREIALRVAMGASPLQLGLQLMCESLLLSAAGAAVGIAIAGVALPLVVRLTPVDIPRLAEAGLSPASLLVSTAIALGTTVFFGLLPALLLLRREVTTDLKSGERGSSRGARRFYSVLVAAEVALACALLTSSALLVRTVERMVTTPLGVEGDEVLTATVQLGSSAYQDWALVEETHHRLLDHVREQPGVRQAGTSNTLPFDVGWRIPFSIQDAEVPQHFDDLPQAQIHSVSDGYFEAMGATLTAGRTFTSFDRPATRGVTIINESFARQYFGDRDPVGGTLFSYATGIGPLGRNLLEEERPYGLEVVGVIRDIRNAPLGQPVEPAFYVPTRQFPFREQLLVVEADDTAMAMAAVRSALGAEAPTVPLAGARTWVERLGERTAEPRLLMTVLLFFGALAALLASLGVYGLFSWSVALRKRELAIRLTLGAQPARVGRLVIRQSGILVAVGIVLGIALVRVAEDVLARVLFEVAPDDVSAVATASGLLVLVALIACVPPAWRAMRVDPVEGLRSE